MNIEEEILSLSLSAVEELYGVSLSSGALPVRATRGAFDGHLTIVVFPLLRLSHVSLASTATALGDYLLSHTSLVSKYTVVKGFLNLTIAPWAWVSLLNSISSTPHFGERVATAASPLVMIEFSSPNSNKPLHLGHVRNNLLGWSLAQILAAAGYRVVKTNIVNDRGIHICKSMLAWQKYGSGATPATTGKKGDHLLGDYYVLFDQHYRAEVSALVAQGMDEASARREAPLLREARDLLVRWEQGDAAVRGLWAMMNAWVYEGFDQTYRTLGVSFDKIYYESDTYLVGRAKVLEGLDKGLFYRRGDGSVWADLTADGLDEKLLLRSDGTSVYMTQDIGTAAQRYADYPIDKMIYVVGNEQNYHFSALAILLDKLGFSWGKALTHFSYGMVALPHGKMKSREGTVVDADDLMAEMISRAKEISEALATKKDIPVSERDEIARIVGLGALKYFILKVDARKNMLFNPDESIDFNGNTGPFIQYTYARIQSILRRARAAGAAVGPAPADYAPNEKEIELIQKVSAYPSIVALAAADYAPSVIANYCYELTKAFNQFYHDYSVLHAASAAARAFRLTLAATVATILQQGMALLGIEMPQRM